jgi:rhodanese-related sulfurtransferase
MTPSHMLLYGLIAVVVLLFARRMLRTRSIPQYSPAEAAKRMKSGPRLLFLDVRTDQERSGQHIKGSMHIPLHQLRARVSELQKHKDKEIVCYCRSGNRSLSAAALLHKQGFTAANMKGGITAWNSSGIRIS